MFLIRAKMTTIHLKKFTKACTGFVTRIKDNAVYDKISLENSKSFGLLTMERDIKKPPQQVETVIKSILPILLQVLL